MFDNYIICQWKRDW